VTEANAQFDTYALNYEEALQAGLKVSGEDSGFFASGRIKETKKAIDRLRLACERQKALDFGCGTGNATESLQEAFRFETVQGVDVSAESLAVARGRFSNPSVSFETIENTAPRGDVDLAFCNGVFHHIEPSGRRDSMAYIYASLKPGGIFVFWENNPWNPGVHYIMKAIPFDRDAQMIFPHRAVKLLGNAGFKVLRLRYFFVFPRALAGLRLLEPALSSLPLGAQYQIVAVKAPR